MRDYFNKFVNKSEFLKNVVTVMTGTAISQIIALAITPVLTRNYSPDDFGFLLIYISILSIIGTCSTGKFERVILLLKSEGKIKSIVVLSFFISIFISFIFFIVLIFGKKLFTFLFSLNESLYRWLFTLCLLIIIYSFFTVFSVVLNYQKRFKELSTARVIKTLSSTTISILCIFFLKDARGLIAGEFFGYLIATFYIVFLNKKFLVFNKQNIRESYHLALRYKKFPIYNVPSDFMNMSSAQMPAFFLTNFFSAGVTGFYSLTKRILDAPMKLISTSILEVFRQKASEKYIKDGNCKALFLKTAKGLSIISIVPFLLLFLFAPQLFSLVFGKEWFFAGEYARIFAIYYYFRFISSPLSYMFYIAERQIAAFFIQLYLFLTTILIFNIPRFVEIDIYSLLWIHTINLTIFYIIMFIFSLKFTININHQSTKNV